jgi:hypothetical protein
MGRVLQKFLNCGKAPDIQRKRPAPLGSTAILELKVKNTFYSRASYLPEADQGTSAFVLHIQKVPD